MVLRLLLMLLILSLSACANVTLKDHTIYALKGPGFGAVKDHTLTTGQSDLTQAEWDAQVTTIMMHKKAVFCMSSDTFADYKSAIEKLCSFHPEDCTYQTKQTTAAIVQKLNTMQTTVLKGH